MSDLVNALSEAASGSSTLPKPLVVNPLAAMAGAAQTAQSVYGVREKQAEQAIGAILQQATDANGNVDYQKAHTLASQAGPVVQMGMQKMLLNSAQLRGAQLEQAQKHTANLGAASISLVNDPSDANLDQVAKIMVSAGYPQNVVDQHVNTMRGMDEGQRRAYALKLGLSNLDPAGRFGAAIGTTGVATMPQGLVPYVQGGILQGGRLMPAQGGVGAELSPGQIADFQKWKLEEREWPDPNSPGGKFQGTREQWLQRMGVDPKMVYPAVPGGGSIPGAPPGTGLPSTLRNPAAAPAPAAPGATAAPAAVPNPAGQPIAVPAQADLDYFRDVSARGVASRDRSAQLGNMLGDVAQFTTGPLAGVTSRARNMAIALGIPGFNAEAQTAQESFNKLASAIAIQQGSGSDARLNVATSANPHQELSPGGARMIIGQLQGNEDYIQARAKLASDYNGTQRKFESEIASNLDPRAFQFARMDPAERQTWYKNLKKADQEKVQKSYNWAHDRGLIAGG